MSRGSAPMRVLVLGGGPDAEREVSVHSSRSVAEGLAGQPGVTVEHVLIDAPDSLANLSADVIVPVLHGAWGEGGPLQDLLERDGRPYVASGPEASRLCMDKLATKIVAAELGIATARASLAQPGDTRSAILPPAVVKPVTEGSSVGLSICADAASLQKALALLGPASPGTMVEAFVQGREITCGLIDRGNGIEPLPLVEICPASGVYDYEAKYTREDTVYRVGHQIDPAVDVHSISKDSVRLAEAIGVRHLARADYILDANGTHWLLEINTMPGFTSHSLVPMAARTLGLGIGALFKRFCELAIAESSSIPRESADC